MAGHAGVTPESIEKAAERIDTFVRQTPAVRDDDLSRRSRGDVFLKLENLQASGSFKLRGASNYLLSHDRHDAFVTASTGNHALACAFVADRLGVNLAVFLPATAEKSKVDALRQHGVAIRLLADECAETEAFAKAHAADNGLPYISPYNDLTVVEGQGTVAVELLDQIRSLDAILVPVGGGGLVSGIALYAKGLHPEIKIIGCSPSNSPAMAESVRSAAIVHVSIKPTMAGATAGNVEEGSVTFPICSELVDSFVEVTEDEIHRALAFYRGRYDDPVEPSGILAVAGYLNRCDDLLGLRTGLIISGGN